MLKVNVTRPSERTFLTKMILPKSILRQISKHRVQLEKEDQAQDKTEPRTITDSVTYDEAALIGTFHFLGGTPLPEVYTHELCEQPLIRLLRSKYVSILLEILSLENAILAHLEDCQFPPMSTKDLVLLAEVAYGPTFCFTVTTSLGKLIGRKLVALLPQLMQDGTAKKIHEEGGTLSS